MASGRAEAALSAMPDEVLTCCTAAYNPGESWSGATGHQV